MHNITLIAAHAQNNVIGKNNQLLWHLPEDMRFFRQTTLNHHVIMGRKTFDSIGKALPNRTNIVITRDLSWQHADVLVTHSFEDALHVAANHPAFVIGGAEIYALALPYADRLIMTEVEANFEGDAFFPVWDKDLFVEVKRERYVAAHPNDFSFSFVEYHRKVALSTKKA